MGVQRFRLGALRGGVRVGALAYAPPCGVAWPQQAADGQSPPHSFSGLFETLAPLIDGRGWWVAPKKSWITIPGW